MTRRGWVLTAIEGFGLASCLQIAEHFGAGWAAAPSIAIAILYYLDGRKGWSI